MLQNVKSVNEMNEPEREREKKRRKIEKKLA